MAKLTRIIKSGHKRTYSYTYLPSKGEKILWEGREKPVFMVRGKFPACQVPFQISGTLLWIKETPLTSKRLESWQPKFSAKINGNSFIVLPLPPECRKKVFEGTELVWTPQEVLAKLQKTFSPDGIFVYQTVSDGSVKTRGFILFDEDCHAYDVECPFCGVKQKIEAFNPLLWRGQCKCGANISFLDADDFDEALADFLGVPETPEPEARGAWLVWHNKVVARKVDETSYVVYQKN